MLGPESWAHRSHYNKYSSFLWKFVVKVKLKVTVTHSVEQ